MEDLLSTQIRVRKYVDLTNQVLDDFDQLTLKEKLQYMQLYHPLKKKKMVRRMGWLTWKNFILQGLFGPLFRVRLVYDATKVKESLGKAA